jgi:NADH-quinone oxidoreductase subunit L
MAFSVAMAVLGIWLAWQAYVVKPGRAKAMGDRFAGAYRVLWHKYYVDEFYHATVVRPLVGFSRFLWKGFDVVVIDGMVNGAGRVVREVGTFLRPIQSGFTGHYATAVLVGAILIMGFVIVGGLR